MKQKKDIERAKELLLLEYDNEEKIKEIEKIKELPLILAEGRSVIEINPQITCKGLIIEGDDANAITDIIIIPPGFFKRKCRK